MMNIGDKYVDPVKGVVELISVDGDVATVRSLLNGKLSHRPVAWLNELQPARKPNVLFIAFSIAFLLLSAGAVAFFLVYII